MKFQDEYDELFTLMWDDQHSGIDYEPEVDPSCEAMLAGTADAHRGADHAYVMRNHITTSCFVRQDMRDTTNLAGHLGIPLDTYEGMKIHPQFGGPSAWTFIAQL